jgi:flagellar motor switch protein FliG
VAQVEFRGKQIPGAQKAAIFLLMMGQEYASEIFKKLDPEEISRLVSYMAETKTVPQQTLTQIMEEFLESIETEGQLVVEGESFLKQVADGALGKERARAVARELEKTGKNVPFGYLDGMDKHMVVNLIKGEHPQTIALILACLKPGAAAEILSDLPEEIRPYVAMRIVRMERVPKEVIQELDHTLHKEVRGLGESGTSEVDGTTVLADILNEIDKSAEEHIMSSIEEQDEEMAEKIRQLMFIFEDLLRVDDRGFREILKNVDKQELSVALRTASEELKEKVFGNMSERARDILREDMEVMGPVRLSEVEEAQQKILKVARQLESEKKISLGMGKEDTLV